MPRGRKKKEIKQEEHADDTSSSKSLHKNKKVGLAMKTLQKKFGKGVIKMGSDSDLLIVKLPTSMKSFNDATDGGFPVGMITEVYGEESAGKGVLVSDLIKQTQAAGEVCAYIDAEHCLDSVWLKKLGVNVDEMIHSEVTDSDNVFDIAKSLIQSKGVKLLIVDSIAALTPKREVEEDMDKQNVGLAARINNKGLRVTNTVNTRQGTAIVFINQMRSAVGVMYGDPNVTPGGRGMKFFAGLRLQVKRGEWYPDTKNRKGHEIICRVTKTKTGSSPFAEARFVLIYETGELKEWSELEKEEEEVIKVE